MFVCWTVRIFTTAFEACFTISVKVISTLANIASRQIYAFSVDVTVLNYRTLINIRTSIVSSIEKAVFADTVERGQGRTFLVLGANRVLALAPLAFLTCPEKTCFA